MSYVDVRLEWATWHVTRHPYWSSEFSTELFCAAPTSSWALCIVRPSVQHTFVTEISSLCSVSDTCLRAVDRFEWITIVKGHCNLLIGGARGSVVGWGTILQAIRSRDRVPMRWILLNLPIFPAALWPWGRLSLLIKWVPGIFLGVGRCIGLTNFPPSVNPLFRQNVGASTSGNHTGLHCLLQG
jgi:hypothetical protein